jgi:heterotetrameric sarcosine oxidase gamma subunit
MAEAPSFTIQAQGLAVRAEAWQAAALRYFDTGSAFALAARAATGCDLPPVLGAHESADGQLLLAWRGPTETLLLTSEAARLAQLEEQLAGIACGCLVNLSGALAVLRVSGDPAPLLCRLGGSASVPNAGEARRARLADVPVLSVCLRSGATLLVVDRAYAAHLSGWIRETLLDFP